MMEILLTVFYIAICVLLFALAILIHEFGHFIVALKLGLRVEAFSIGFGHALWKRTYKGVEYRLSWIPLGGYVSIPDVDPEGTKALEGAKHETADPASEQPPKVRIPAWKEVMVAVAGPAMNLVLAFILAVILSLVPSARFGELLAVIGRVPEQDMLAANETDAKGPAFLAGLKAGDRVVSVGGNPVRTWTEMMTEVQIAGEHPTPFVVARRDAAGNESEVTLTVTPRRNAITDACYIMAISVTNEAKAAAWMPDRSPVRQLLWDAGSIFRVLKGLVTPKEARQTANAIGGPVMIAEGLYRQVRQDTWDGIGFLRFLNVNLAILNLLPIPVLDGGLILFALFALVFRRRVPDFLVKYASLTFMVLLMGLMGLLIVRDGWRSYKIHSYKPNATDVRCSTGDALTNGTTNATSQGR